MIRKSKGMLRQMTELVNLAKLVNKRLIYENQLHFYIRAISTLKIF